MRRGFNIFIVVLAAVIVWTVWFYWKNLRGISPAINKPPADITTLLPPSTPAQRPVLEQPSTPLVLPPGFVIGIFAKDLGAPRVLLKDPNGTLLVSIPQQGRVVALPDRNDDGAADETITVASNLQKPHGLALKCEASCKLFIAEENQVASYDYDPENFRVAHKTKLADLPTGGNHTSRTIIVMPPPNDHQLLISIGSSCNVCNEKDERRASILVYDLITKEVKHFARGLRNAVFMTVHPNTKKIWVTEMGRDLLGDDLPPDEINIVEVDKNYGWPMCYGKNIHDTAFDRQSVYKRNPCMEPFEIPSYIDIPAHSAPLGLAFVPATPAWPQEFHSDLLVSYHGSWNRSTPTGYKIARFKLDEQGRYEGADNFISGWLTKDGALGRPVDILIHQGGIYVSDDKAGVIYRISYTGAI